MSAMPTARIYFEDLNNNINGQKFPIYTCTILNKTMIREIVSIYKLRIFSYNFQYDLKQKHYQIKHSEICICGEQDTYLHIPQCEALQDLVEEFKAFRNYDLLKLLTYNQNYISHNFPTQRQLQQIDLGIKYFHSKLLRRRIQILEQNDEQIEELLKQFIQKADQEEINQSRLRQDQ